VEPIEGLEVGPTTWAPPQYRVKGLHEEFGVHEGTIRGSLPLTFTAPPGHGDQVVQVRVTYQARSEANAFPALSIRLDLLVQERPLIGRVLPSEGKT
jgi:hypothetical protein